MIHSASTLLFSLRVEWKGGRLFSQISIVFFDVTDARFFSSRLSILPEKMKRYMKFIDASNVLQFSLISILAHVSLIAADRNMYPKSRICTRRISHHLTFVGNCAFWDGLGSFAKIWDSLGSFASFWGTFKETSGVFGNLGERDWEGLPAARSPDYIN